MEANNPSQPQVFRRTRSLRRVHTTFSLSGPQLETTYDDYSPTCMPRSPTSPQLTSSSLPASYPCPPMPQSLSRNAQSMPSDMTDFVPNSAAKVRSSFRQKMSRSFSFRKLRKRENATAADEESGGGANKADSSSFTAVSVLGTVIPDSQVVDIEFTDKRRGLWQKTVHSVMLRLKGQEQHKDVYVMPDALKEQLKQVYVY